MLSNEIIVGVSVDQFASWKMTPRNKFLTFVHLQLRCVKRPPYLMGIVFPFALTCIISSTTTVLSISTSSFQYQFANFSDSNYSKTGKASLKLQLINQRADFSFALFRGGLSNVRASY